MFFSNELIERSKNDPIQSIIEICDDLQHLNSWEDDDYETYLEGYALISALIDAQLINLTAFTSNQKPSLVGEKDKDLKALNKWLPILEADCKSQSNLMKIETFKSKFKVAIGNSFHYEFSQGDLDRVQKIINELRTQISDSKLVAEHKQRLLARLEKMQAELHKKVSDLDRFWGVIGDAGVVIGKLGTDAKPIVDRLRELKEIIWSTQSRAEELPSGTSPPILENNPDTGQGKIEA